MEGEEEDKVDFVVVEHLDRLHTAQQQLICDVTEVKDRVQKLEAACERDHQLLIKLCKDSRSQNDLDPIWLYWLPLMMVALAVVFFQRPILEDTKDWADWAAFTLLLVLTGELIRQIYKSLSDEWTERSTPEGDEDADTESEGEEIEGEADDRSREMEAGDITASS